MNIRPVMLEGDKVRMEPLKPTHAESLAEFAFDKELWRWTANVVNSDDDLRLYIERALDEQERGISLPFVTIDRKSGKVVGSSRFGDIDIANRKVEIGWTWVGAKWQRTHVNTEAKLLMLTHAFETWNCIRVELKTDALNSRSRAAIRRIGAVEEGTLCNHMITDSGRFRDSVYFSIIDSEWESVNKNLKISLERH